MKTFYLTDSGKVRDHNEDSVTILKNANVITGYRNGNQICYKIENPKVIKILKQMV